MQKFKINSEIRIKECRLVGKDGEQHGVMPLYKALELTKKSGLDLVEVAPTSKPPVCKILDYGKFKYEQEKRGKSKEKVIELKEVRIRPNIGENDLAVKIRWIKKTISDGDKVKIVVVFKGRESTHFDLGWKLLEKIIEECTGEIKIESQPKLEGGRMFMVIAPLKKDK